MCNDLVTFRGLQLVLACTILSGAGSACFFGALLDPFFLLGRSRSESLDGAGRCTDVADELLVQRR